MTLKQFVLVCLFYLGLGASPIATWGNDTGQTPDDFFHFYSQSDFVNISATAKEESFKVKWSINYDTYNSIQSKNYSYSIRYATRNDFKSSQKNPWKQINNVPLQTTEYEISGLEDNADYYYSVGLNTGREIIWSNDLPVRTRRSWGLFKLVIIIGSLGLFIYGLKIMGEGLQQNLGTRIRHLLTTIASNRIKAMVTGFSMTTIIQSVVASMVMIVSFVNTGLLTLVQSAGLMLGATVGVAVTTWLINLLAFEVNLSSYALFIFAFAVPILFFGHKRWKAWLNTIFGIVFLILGLSFMVESMPNASSDIPFLNTFISWSQIPFIGTLLCVVAGAGIAVLFQSTIASIALIMTMLYATILPFDIAVAMALGTGLGTSINVEFAVKNANVYAKRAARIHTMYNGIGVLWALILLPFLIQGVQQLMLNFNLGDPINYSGDYGSTGLAIFLTLYLVINALVLAWFVPSLVRLSERLVKSRGAADEMSYLSFIGTGLLSTADLSIIEAKKEIAKFGKLTTRMSTMVRSLLFEKNSREFEKIMQRIEKYEDITDKMEIEVVKYLNKLSEGDLTPQTAKRIRGMNSMVNDLERIGDIFYQMSKTLERKVEEKLWFTPEQRNDLAKMFDLIDQAMVIMCDNLTQHHEKVSLSDALKAEEQINQQRNELRRVYLEGLSNQQTNFKGGMIYNELFSSLEKVGDHIINVSEAIVGKV